MIAVWRELKMAVLSLKRAPGFVATSVGTLAVTLAALLLVVSISSAYLLEPLVYPDAEEWLMAEQEIHMEDYVNTKFQTMRGHVHWYKTQSSFETMTLVLPDKDIFLDIPGEPRLSVSFVTPEYMTMFEVPLLMGRGFGSGEALDNKATVALISERLWRTRYNGAEDILEQSFEMGQKQYQIIGVVDDSFIEPHMFDGVESEIWFPFDATWYYESEWGNSFGRLRAIGKPRAGVTRSQIITDLENQIESVRAEWKEQWKELLDINPHLRTFRDAEVGNNSKLSLMLLAGAVSLLLIAIVNVTNLFFSRAVAKQKMLAIQAVLGARRRRLFYALLAESTVICVSAALLGLFLAAWGLKGFILLATGELPLLHALSLDMVVFATALAVSLALSLLFAYTTSRLINYQQLRHYIQSSGKGGANQVSGRTVKGLITAQITLASVLLIFSAMILSKAIASKSLAIGADISNVYNVQAFHPNREVSLEEKAVMAAEIREKLLLADGVADVGLGQPPISLQHNANSVSTLEGKFIGMLHSNWVHRDYFDFYDIQLLRGRLYSDEAMRGEAREMIVSASAAKKLMPEGDALGQRFIGLEDKPYEVVGIVEDVNDPRYYATDLGVRVWWPAQMWSFPLQIRMQPGHSLTRDAINARLKDINDQVAIWHFTSQETEYHKALYQETLTVYLTVALAIFTLILASAGIYGVLSYNSSLRRFEFGIRMALGAKKQRLYRLMGRESLVPVAMGMVFSGVIVAAVLVLFRKQLDPWMTADLPYMLVAVVITLAIALIASALPVRALLKGNPIAALRNE